MCLQSHALAMISWGLVREHGAVWSNVVHAVQPCSTLLCLVWPVTLRFSKLSVPSPRKCCFVSLPFPSFLGRVLKPESTRKHLKPSICLDHVHPHEPGLHVTKHYVCLIGTAWTCALDKPVPDPICRQCDRHCKGAIDAIPLICLKIVAQVCTQSMTKTWEILSLFFRHTSAIDCLCKR